MQLKNKQKFIRGALAMATTTMLAGGAQGAQAKDGAPEWEVDSAVLFYSEADRVSVIEPVIRMRKEIDDDEFLNVRIVLDALTGSSANGAIKTGSAQTFTSTSGGDEDGGGTYTTPANTTPLDPSFKDTRAALNVEWEKPLSENLRGIFGINASGEYDYFSLGMAATLSWDTNNKNTTYTAGASYNFDIVDPVGGVPVGLTALKLNKATSGSTDDKKVADVLLGVTQVLSRDTLVQLNYTYGSDDGYLTDPYKILSVVTSGTTLRGVDPYLLEKRPDARERQAVFGKLVHQFSEDVLHLSYRYYWDDWGIKVHTVDLRYRSELGGGHYLQPHVRYSDQSKADFYYYKLIDGAIPQYASADYRLDDMTTTTVGIKYGIEIDKDSDFGMRVEGIQQSSTNTDLDAVLFQINYSLKF